MYYGLHEASNKVITKNLIDISFKSSCTVYEFKFNSDLRFNNAKSIPFSKSRKRYRNIHLHIVYTLFEPSLFNKSYKNKQGTITQLKGSSLH